MSSDSFTATQRQDTLCDGGQLRGSSSISLPPPPSTSSAAPYAHPSNTSEGAAAAAADIHDDDDDGGLDDFSDSLGVDLDRGDSLRAPADLDLDALDSVPRKWNDSLDDDGEDSRSLDSLESGQTSFYSAPTGRSGSFQTLSPFGSEATLYLSEGRSTETLYHSPSSSLISGLISRSCNELVPGHSASAAAEEEAQTLFVGRGHRRRGSPQRHSFYGSLNYPVSPTERQVSDFFGDLDSYASPSAGRKRSSTISAYPVEDEAPSFYSSDIGSRTSASARDQFLQANILKDGEGEKNKEGKHTDGGSEEEEEEEEEGDDDNDGDDEEKSAMSTQDDNTAVRAGVEGNDKERKDRKGLISSLRKNRKSGKKKLGKGPGGPAGKTDENDSTNSSQRKDDEDTSSVTTVESVASAESSSPQITSDTVNGRATPKGSNTSSKSSSPALTKSPKSEKTDKSKLSSFLSRKDPKKKKPEMSVSSSKTSITSSTMSEDPPSSSASLDTMATAEAGEDGGEGGGGGTGRGDSLKRDPGASAAMTSTKISHDTSGRATPSSPKPTSPTPASPTPASPSFRSFVSTMHVMKNESIMPSFDVHPKGSAMTRGTASVSELHITPTVNSPKMRGKVASPKSPKAIDHLSGRDSDGYSSSNPGSPAPGSPAPTVVKRPKIFSFNKNKELKKDQPKKEKEKEKEKGKEEKKEKEKEGKKEKEKEEKMQKENIKPEISTTTNSSTTSADPQIPAEASAAKVKPPSPTPPIVVPVEPHAPGRSPQPLSPQLYAPFTSELEKNLNKRPSLTEGSPAKTAPTKRTSLTETSIIQSLIRRASLSGSGSDQNIVKRPSTSDTASEQPLAKRAAVLGEAAAPAKTEDLSGKPKTTTTPPPSPPPDQLVPTDETVGIVARRASLFGGSKQSLTKRAESTEDNLGATPSGGEPGEIVAKSTSEKNLNRRSTTLDQLDSSTAATTAATLSGAAPDKGRSKTRSAETGLDRLGRTGSEGTMPHQAVRVRNGRPPSSPPLSSPPSSPEGERGVRETPEGDRDHSLPNPFVDSSGRITDSWAGASTDKREHLYKILVIGELGTGKTSIIKRYVHQFFSQHYRATIGVDFALKVLNWDSNTVVRLQLWDIAGQERFGNMTRVYYKEAVGAFIVFDVTRAQTFDAITKWKTDLDTKVTLPDGSPIPAVLLANKCDQPKEGVVNNPTRMDDYCRERGFCGWFETSAKENINIDEAARFLVNKILSNERQGLMLNESIDPDKFSVDGKTKPADKSGCAC